VKPAAVQASVWHVFRALTKPLFSDRELPPAPGTPAPEFEALYARRPDPWGVLGSPLAQQRYLTLVEAVGRYGPCGSILDVGCGEGALTRYLVGCASEVTGIDASRTAIERARGLVPRATFHCCTLEDFRAERVFDVVLAVEILYYVTDVDLAIQKLVTLGRSVVVSYTSRERQRLEPYLDPYCAPDQRVFYPFFGLSRFGFTVAHLSPRQITASSAVAVSAGSP
jgi:SAM-dependent methyltransferase